MTIRDALRDGIRYIRLPGWDPGAHIELPLLPGGGHGPWATVRDVSGEQQVFIATLTADHNDRYEEALV